MHGTLQLFLFLIERWLLSKYCLYSSIDYTVLLHVIADINILIRAAVASSPKIRVHREYSMFRISKGTS